MEPSDNFTILWRQNERDDVSNHRRLECLHNVCSGADQRKHKSSGLLAFVSGIHRWPEDSPYKRPVTRKMFPLDDVIMIRQPAYDVGEVCLVISTSRHHAITTHTVGCQGSDSSYTWWRHQMETFAALLALCAGNSPVPVNSPHKGQWRGALMFSLIYAWINDWVNNREAGDLIRHRGHYDVIVMIWSRQQQLSWFIRDCNNLAENSNRGDMWKKTQKASFYVTPDMGSRGRPAYIAMMVANVLMPYRH